jgi:hypothetical protein
MSLSVVPVIIFFKIVIWLEIEKLQINFSCGKYEKLECIIFEADKGFWIKFRNLANPLFIIE